MHQAVVEEVQLVLRPWRASLSERRPKAHSAQHMTHHNTVRGMAATGALHPYARG